MALHASVDKLIATGRCALRLRAPDSLREPHWRKSMSAASSSATGTCQPQSNKVILRQVDALYSPPAALPKSPSPTNVPAGAFRAQEDSVCKCLLDRVPRKHAGARGSAAAGPSCRHRSWAFREISRMHYWRPDLIQNTNKSSSYICLDLLNLCPSGPFQSACNPSLPHCDSSEARQTIARELPCWVEM